MPLAFIACPPQTVLACALLAADGAGAVVVDIACFTLLQQAPDEVRARVFGVLEGLAVGAVGVGSALGGVLAVSVGIRPALLVAAAVPLLCGLAATRIAPSARHQWPVSHGPKLVSSTDERRTEMTTIEFNSEAKELDSRSADGIDAQLLWYPALDTVTVAVSDAKDENVFELAVESRAALDAFRHPFAYRAWASTGAQAASGEMSPSRPFSCR